MAQASIGCYFFFLHIVVFFKNNILWLQIFITSECTLSYFTLSYIKLIILQLTQTTNNKSVISELVVGSLLLAEVLKARFGFLHLVKECIKLRQAQLCKA